MAAVIIPHNLSGFQPNTLLHYVSSGQVSRREFTTLKSEQPPFLEALQKNQCPCFVRWCWDPALWLYASIRYEPLLSFLPVASLLHQQQLIELWVFMTLHPSDFWACVWSSQVNQESLLISGSSHLNYISEHSLSRFKLYIHRFQAQKVDSFKMWLVIAGEEISRSNKTIQRTIFSNKLKQMT